MPLPPGPRPYKEEKGSLQHSLVRTDRASHSMYPGVVSHVQVALLREMRPERLHAVEISSVDGFQVCASSAVSLAFDTQLCV